MKRFFILSILAMTLCTSSVMAQHKSSRKAKVTNVKKSSKSSSQQQAFRQMMSILDKATRKVKAASSKYEAYDYVQEAKAEIQALQEKYPNGELSEQLTESQTAEYNKRTQALTNAVFSK